MELNIKTMIATLGGRKTAAELCGVSVDAVKKWEGANRVPSKHWVSIVNATNRGVTYDMLGGQA